MNIVWNPSPNFTTGRAGMTPWAIVNHITAGSMDGCLVWLCNPASQGSSHYLVTRKGQVFQLVKDEDTAWGNGIVNLPSWPMLLNGVNPNRYTLSIEHEGQPGQVLTEEQYQASLDLHRYLCGKWSILRDRLHIIGHYEIDSVNRSNCPGSTFPWQRLIEDLNRVRIRIDGEQVDTYAELRDGRTLVHARFAELLGYMVDWNGADMIVDLKKVQSTGQNI